MRVGMAGLAALYWPLTLGKQLRERSDVVFPAVATLGVDDATLRQTLGRSALDYGSTFNVRLYDSAEEMVAAEQLDTVVLITRHSEHAAWAERLAALGVNLFIPKTFATIEADAERIVQAQKQFGVQIAVGPSARFLPPFLAVKQAIDAGRIGQPFALRLCHHHGVIDVFNPHDWYRDPAEGGPELSLGWYGIDLILHLMGSHVKSVLAEYGNFTSPDSPFMDCGRMTLRLDDGGIASFDMYFCNRFAYPAWQLEVVGPDGVLSIHRTTGGANQTVVTLDSADGYEVLPLPAPTGARTPGWELFWVDDFLAGRRPTIDAEQAALITQVALAARQSAQAGRPVTL
jgi:myo-inositol 2-dehydrogenase/D-chiro-inositol 1-dehydrogenase